MRGGVFGPREKGCCSPTNVTELFALPVLNISSSVASYVRSIQVMKITT
jgi:hypothetical protein